MTVGRSRDGEGGFALVSVLWAVSILSLIAAAMLSIGTVSSTLERNALRRIEADNIAEFAIHRTILALLDGRAEQRWRIDGVAQTVSLLDTPVAIEIQDVLGLVDLNDADVSTLERLFRSAGLSADDAKLLANRIVAWRSSEDNHSISGVSSADYRSTDRNYKPRNASFQSIDELQLVLGMTPDLFHKIAPALTVHSHQPNVDARIAPREVLLSLPGMDTGSVNDILARRHASPGTFDAQGRLLSAGIIDPATSVIGRAFAITIEFTHAGTRVRRASTVRLTNDSSRPFMVLDWD